MTDKQIKIDGIDVSKCKYIDIENFEKPICHCISQRNECKMPCEYNKDCYYKQLKRKEQECEKLKKAKKATEEASELFVKNADEIARLLENKLDQLKAENEELKAQLEQQKKENEEFKEKLSQVKDITEPLNSELPEDKVIREIFLIVNDCINQKVNPYKQAIDEIEHQVTELFLGVENKNRTYCEKILDIINSVKDKNVPHKAKEGE